MAPIAREEVTCEVLMTRFQAGDPQALATLVGRHKRPLYNFVLRHVRSPAAAEDLVQDVFVKIVQGAGEFRLGSRFSTWAYTIARHLCADHLRQATSASPDLPRGDGASGDRSTMGAAPAPRTPPAPPPSPGATIGDQHGQRFARGVEALPEEEREVFLLREVANLPFKEIAVVTGAPEDTVKRRMRAALERLQGSLDEYEDHVRAR
jgi:RNA polymerase sigma-70 factor (ECF subfamily)